jgi:hypothetical protein
LSVPESFDIAALERRRHWQPWFASRETGMGRRVPLKRRPRRVAAQSQSRLVFLPWILHRVLIVEEIRWARKTAIARTIIRTVIGGLCSLRPPSQTTWIVKLVRFAGASNAADRSHTLLESFETAVGCTTPTAAIRCAPWVWVVRRRLGG